MDQPGARVAPFAIPALLCLVGLSGCGDATSPPELPERFARRFLPFDPKWIPESQIPDATSMVVWELTETLEEPTPEQRAAADEWVERCYESARRHGWYEFRKGLEDGWEKMTRDPSHYRNREYVLDDRILDPDRPEFLMYSKRPDGSMGLTGFMFITKELDDRGPQFGGSLTLWHYHVWKRPQCVERGVLALDFANARGKCLAGEPRHRSPEMIHTWLIDHPGGPFATSMNVSEELVSAGLEKRLRERGF